MITRKENYISRSGLSSNERYIYNANQTSYSITLPGVSSFKDISYTINCSQDELMSLRTKRHKGDEEDSFSSVANLYQILNINNNQPTSVVRDALLEKLESKEGSLALQKIIDCTTPSLFQLIYEMVSIYYKFP